jgi:hypothetical protein
VFPLVPPVLRLVPFVTHYVYTNCIPQNVLTSTVVPQMMEWLIVAEKSPNGMGRALSRTGTRKKRGTCYGQVRTGTVSVRCTIPKAAPRYISTTASAEFVVYKPKVNAQLLYDNLRMTENLFWI